MSRILYLFFFLTSSLSFGQAREMTLLQLEKDRFNAMINRDSSKLARILADDLLYIHSNGVTDSKETFIKNIMSGKLEYLAVDLHQADIRTHNQTAWIHGAAKMKVRAGKDNPEVELFIRFLDVYKREGGTWRLVAWQSARVE
jgi:ketosteroid isomerase-like protein